MNKITLMDFMSPKDKKILQSVNSTIPSQGMELGYCCSDSKQVCYDCYYNISAAIGKYHNDKIMRRLNLESRR